MTSPARAERAALLDLLSGAGPDAPTLCAGWTTHDLAAHLVVRDRQPLAVPGYVVPRLQPVSAWFERRARTTPYAGLLDRLREGPPPWSPLGSRVDAVYQAANLHEFFVHCEDVRRAVDPTPRPPSGPLDDALWDRLRVFGPALTRRARGLRIELATPDGRSRAVGRGPAAVTLHGRPGELLLWLFGRRTVAEVAVEGDRAALEAAPIGP